MFGISEYIAMALAGTLLVGGLYSKSVVSKLELDLLKEQTQHNICNRNNGTLRASIDTQNEAIARISVDYNKSMVELGLWKNKPDIVKYETIYKYISDVNISEGDCNEVIDAISNISFYDL